MIAVGVQKKRKKCATSASSWCHPKILGEAKNFFGRDANNLLVEKSIVVVAQIFSRAENAMALRRQVARSAPYWTFLEVARSVTLRSLKACLAGLLII